ncbi:hypothetical protein EJB05_17100, partial [Eragrostis curvula]
MAADHHGDRLSDLPDAILVSILSLLRIDEAARCSVLATRWRHLFPSTLLDFNAFLPQPRNVIDAVESILAAHPTARVRSFSASRINFRGKGDPSAGGWLQKLARRGVQELSLDFDYDFSGMPQIPASLFACASLTRLETKRCTFPKAPASPLLALARLTEIKLFYCQISDSLLRATLSQCTALERLKITGCGRTQHSLYGSAHAEDEWNEKLPPCPDPVSKPQGPPSRWRLRRALVIEYAPILERALSEDMHLRTEDNPRRGVRLKILHAPKLEVLGYLSLSFHAMEIGKTSFTFTEDHILVETLMPSLKTLAIEVSYKTKGYINWVMQLLKVFPCIETLFIKSNWKHAQSAAPDSWDVLTYIPCVDDHLEKVVFEIYTGHKWQRNMAKFLHRRSRFLKTMEFHCINYNDNKDDPSDVEWSRKQQELLSLESRASRECRFFFYKYGLFLYLSNYHSMGYKKNYHRCKFHEV